MNILHLDPQFAVVEKEPGILSQDDGKGRRNLPRLLREEIGGEIFPVHRLDRETGGIMVYARTSSAASCLSKAIAEGSFYKEYHAVLCACPNKTEDTLTDLLFYDRQKNKVFPVKRERKGVKRAVLHYHLIASSSPLALVRVNLQTGRTHQIRVQFAGRKMPLWGDPKYGGKGSGLALFCSLLSFPHPETGNMLSFTLPLPETEPWSLFDRKLK